MAICLDAYSSYAPQYIIINITDDQQAPTKTFSFELLDDFIKHVPNYKNLPAQKVCNKLLSVVLIMQI